MIDFEDWVKLKLKEDPGFIDEDGYIAYRPHLWPEDLQEPKYEHVSFNSIR